MDPAIINKIDSYKVPSQAIDLLKKSKIVFIVGISGAGKDTVLKELLKTDKYRLIISHTTRSPRENQGILEQDGKDYYFVSQDEIAKMLDNQEFIEAKQYSGNVYGTTLAEVEKSNEDDKIAVADIEVQGVAEYKRVAPNVTAIFILPPDFDTWQKRLRARYGDKEPNPEDIRKRMETAKKELAEALAKDYFEFVINDDLYRTVNAVDEIALGNLSKDKNAEAKGLAQELLAKL